MTGEQLKHIIERSGYTKTDLANKLGIMPQQLNNVFNSNDIKTGMLERIADILGVPVYSLYGGTQTNSDKVAETTPSNYDAIKRRDEQIDRLLSIIEKMQENGNRRADY